MFSFRKTKEIYHSPLTKVSEVDLEGIVCGSEVFTNIQADELFNKAETGEDGLGRGSAASYIEI